MPQSRKKIPGHTYDSLYDLLDIKRSTYREWMSQLMPDHKWEVISSEVLLFVRVIRDSIRLARMMPSEMHTSDWKTVYEKIDGTPLNKLREFNLFCYTVDGTVELVHRSISVPIRAGLSPLPFSELVDQHLIGLSNIGSNRPNNVTLLADRSEQYFEQPANNEEAG